IRLDPAGGSARDGFQAAPRPPRQRRTRPKALVRRAMADRIEHYLGSGGLATDGFESTCLPKRLTDCALSSCVTSVGFVWTQWLVQDVPQSWKPLSTLSGLRIASHVYSEMYQMEMARVGRSIDV